LAGRYHALGSVDHGSATGKAREHGLPRVDVVPVDWHRIPNLRHGPDTIVERFSSSKRVEVDELVEDALLKINP
jgi:hypothetical protein